MSIRSFLCLIIGVLAVLLLLTLTPRSVKSPKGIALPADKISRPAASVDNVVVYHQAPSGDFKVLGQVRAEAAFQKPLSQSRNELMRYVKTLAAKLGANGLIVQVLVPDNGVQQAFTFIGEAVYLQKPATKSQGV